MDHYYYCCHHKHMTTKYIDIAKEQGREKRKPIHDSQLKCFIYYFTYFMRVIKLTSNIYSGK